MTTTEPQPTFGKLPRIRVKRATLRVRGTSPLIVHDWRDRLAITASMTPEEMFEQARIYNDDGFDCVPAAYFKLAAVDAADAFASMSKAAVRGALFVGGDFVPIDYERVDRREDVIELKKGERTYGRPEYHGWSCQLQLEYNGGILKPEDVIELFEKAGTMIGIGRRRPQESGEFGMFTVLAA
jgi:hypothetical protein